MLLVTSSRRPEHWIVPGGGVEPEEEASVTAIREVLEEAGVLGQLGRSLGVFEVRVRTFTCTISNYYYYLHSIRINVNSIKFVKNYSYLSVPLLLLFLPRRKV